MIKNLPTTAGDIKRCRVQIPGISSRSLGQKDPLEEGMAWTEVATVHSAAETPTQLQQLSTRACISIKLAKLQKIKS